MTVHLRHSSQVLEVGVFVFGQPKAQSEAMKLNSMMISDVKQVFIKVTENVYKSLFCIYKDQTISVTLLLHSVFVCANSVMKRLIYFM